MDITHAISVFPLKRLNSPYNNTYRFALEGFPFIIPIR